MKLFDMKTMHFIFACCLLAACGTKDKKTTEDPTPVKPDTTAATKPAKPSPASCYGYADVSDTITLTVIRLDTMVTGTLTYRLKEKDRNEGSIQGKIQGELLIADYNFMSEGEWSVRPVVFKLENGVYVEGYGPTVTENGKMRFKDIKSLKYDTKVKLAEYTCK